MKLSGTFFGFDFGEKRIGVATGQLITATASILTVIPANQGTPAWDKLDQLIQQWKPIAAVVGIPYDMDNQKTAITHKALQFAEQLRQRYSWQVFEIDEKLSSFAARTEIKKSNKPFVKSAVDQLSAKLILESFLQQWRSHE
ncbi:MAG: Holliday junction resolvase RuvX [Legionellales bacterium]|nr:Holliday junction resolvase RuvX [Legionellales bacterium]